MKPAGWAIVELSILTIGIIIRRNVLNTAVNDLAPCRQSGPSPTLTSSRLLVIEEIKELKAGYFKCPDTKDWIGVESVFADHAISDTRAANRVRHPITGEWIPELGGDGQIFEGRQNLVNMIRSSVGHLYTVHHGHIPEIEILSATEALGTWPMS